MSKRSGRPSAGCCGQAEAGNRRAVPRPRKNAAKCIGSRLPLALLVSELTERKLPRVARRRIQAELERQIADRTSQLAEANASLLERVEQLTAERQTLQGQLQASDHERRLIGYELHDGVSQQLLGAKMLFESHQRSLAQEDQKPEAAYHQGMEALVRAAAEVRSLMNRRRNAVLEREGLVAAIAEVSAQLQTVPGAPRIEFRHTIRFQRLEPILEDSLLRIAQEGLGNACRHSRSDEVRVTLTQLDGRVTLEVRDWGVGFDRTAVRKDRLGLESLRERARFLGGRLVLESAPGRGTRVRVTLPLQEVVAHSRRADAPQASSAPSRAARKESHE